MDKNKKVTTYDQLKSRIFSAIETKGKKVGDYIPPQTGIYWLIGEKLVWYAEELFEELAFDLRKKYGKQWNAKDLSKMFRLYMRHPTVAKLSGRCVGRKSMSLDELLDVGK